MLDLMSGSHFLVVHTSECDHPAMLAFSLLQMMLYICAHVTFISHCKLGWDCNACQSLHLVQVYRRL